MTSPANPAPRHGRNCLWAIFLGAVAVRWAYDLALFAAMGREGLMGADSHGYMSDAQAMAAQALAGNLHGWAWLGSDLGVMPAYPWLLTLNVALFGTLAPLTIVLMQGLLDGGTCLLVYLIARAIDERIALYAAIAAAINPTQIVLSGLIYNDTLFLFFTAVALYGAVDWLRRPSWRAALIIGFGLGLSALDRVFVALWAPFLVVILLAIGAAIGRIRLQNLLQMAVAGAMLCLCISPAVLRNVTQYGSWSLTDQGGAHLALWIAPLVREAKDGTPWERASAEAERRTVARFGAKPTNPFVSSQHYAAIGREQLAELGPAAIVKAWVVGAVINLAAPAIIISPPIAQLPRTGFFATRGNTIFVKVFNFFFHSGNAIYAWALLIGTAGVAAVRLLQLAGFFVLVRDRTTWPPILLLALWTGFILAINGPIASPKYRLPIEPALCVLTGAGLCWLRRRGQPAA